MANARDDLLTVEEACAELGVSRPTLYKFAREYPRWFKNYRRGRRRVFTRDGIERFQQEHQTLTQL
jgi:excisionase family DNA binding protein